MQFLFKGVLARSAGVSLINYDNRIFTNYLGQDKVIVHKGLSHWNKDYINEKWDEVSITALGKSRYRKLQEDKDNQIKEANAKAIERKRLINVKLQNLKEKRALEQYDLKDNHKHLNKSDLDLEEEKRLNETLRQREEELKIKNKNIQPYQF